MQQMDRHMQYRIMDQGQMMQQKQQQRMGLTQQQQIVNNMLDNRRDDLQQRRMLQYSMDNNQMMMHRDNVHDMSVMRVMTKREAEGEADGEAGYGYQTYSETPFTRAL